MTSVEFEHKKTADHFRKEHPNAICPDDDARLKTVRFAGDAPQSVLREAERKAFQEAEEEGAKSGQVPLTDDEKDRLDFSRDGVNIPKAQSVKAIALDAGVDDWLSYFDPELEVDEHRSIYDDAGAKSGGRRLDNEETGVEKAGRAARTAEAEECNHAEGHCKHGDPDACEFLKNECSFSEDQVERILDDTTGDPAGGDLPGPVYHGLDRQWTQFKAGLGETKRAAAAINEIREQYGQDPLAFDELGGETITKEDLPA